MTKKMTKRNARKLAQEILYGVSFSGGDIFNQVVLSYEISRIVGDDDYLPVYNAAQSIIVKLLKLLGR